MASKPALLVRIGLFLLFALTLHGQAPTAEPPAPAAGAPVQQLLTSAAAQSAADAHASADRAVALARENRDGPGEALAQRLRASQLAALNRGSDAQAAWRDTEAAWKRVGDGPGQIEAIGWLAVLDVPATDQTAELLRRAIALAGAETTRPRRAVTSLVELGRRLLDRSRLNESRDVYVAAGGIAERTLPESLELALALSGQGDVALTRGDLKTASETYGRALAIREKIGPGSLDVAASLSSVSVVLRGQGDLRLAREYQQRALDIRQRLLPDSLDVASSLGNLGLLARDAGDLTASRDYQTRALAIREQQAPNSTAVAASLNALGTVSVDSGDLAAAREYFQRALTVRQRLAPESLQVAASFNNLGNIAVELGEFAVARDYHQRALAIREKVAPASSDVATSLVNLGVLARNEGDLALARDLHERALKIFQAASPNSLDVVGTWTNLAFIADNQGDANAAIEYSRQALELVERVAPSSPTAAASLDGAGTSAAGAHDLDQARAYLTRALEIRQRLSPDSLTVAATLNNLGQVVQQQGDLDAAVEYLQRAVAINQRLAPDSGHVAVSLDSLGAALQAQGKLTPARQLFQQALAIRTALGAQSLDTAAMLHDLASVDYALHDTASALDESARAWAIVRLQAKNIVLDERRQDFESRYHAIGSEFVRYQVALGRASEGFAALEEGRAQALLQLIAQRGIVRRLARDADWANYELAQAASDRAERKLESTADLERKAKTALDAEVAQRSAEPVIAEKRRLLAERQRDTEQVRQAFTRARLEAEHRWLEVIQSIQAALPQPLDATAARAALPAGALLASFAVGEEGATLFLVAHDGPVRAFPLAIAEKELTARVEFVRCSVSREGGARGLKVADCDDVRIQAARDLYQKLFPAEARAAIEHAGRVILSPDGPLWDLPFAALVMNESGKPEYLGLTKPLVYAQSLTTFAQAQSRAAPGRSVKVSVLVVGNPLFDNALRSMPPTRAGFATAKRGERELATLSRDGTIPEPLPYAEEEATAVAKLYGARAATGALPTEAWFRAQAPQADIIHLATHGYFNPYRAVSSGVRLAVPEQPPASNETDNDGALQAWEVFNLPLRADLIVLSACETGVGSKVPGEGLVGLTRAFQVAGARSIIATQWRVADRSTSAGMVALHQQLRAGAAKDEALRQAMRKLAADPATAHPYYWAPFVLVGDYRPPRAGLR